MHANANIRETILVELFTKPRVLHHKEYDRANRILFPGRDDFTNFLSSDDDQERRRYSHKIINRLVFQHRLSPPSSLLRNLLEYEDNLKPTRGTYDYVPQDHFVHLVHLYLYGIWLFARYAPFHSLVLSELNRTKRNLLSSPTTDGKLHSDYNLFAVAWSSAILYHDVAYPIESITPSERNEPNAKTRARLAPFTNISSLAVWDIIVRALSRLIAFHTVVSNSPESIEDYCIHGQWHVKRNGTTVPVSNELNDLVKQLRHLPLVIGHECVSLLLSFLAPANIFAILEHVAQGIPVLMLSLDPKKEECYLCEGAFFNRFNRYTLAELTAGARMADNFHNDFVWRYSALSPLEEWTTQMKCIFENRVLEEKFLSVVSRIEKQPDYKKLFLGTKVSSSELVFAVVNTLSANPPNFEEQGFEVSKSLSKAYSKGRSRIPLIVGDSVAKYLKTVDRNAFEPYSANNFRVTAEKAVSLLQQRGARQHLVKDVEKGLEDDPIIAKERLEIDIKDCIAALVDNLIHVFPTDKELENPFRQGATRYFPSEVNLKAAISESDFKDLSKTIRANMNNLSLKQLLDRYRIGWPKLEGVVNSDDVVDHGFAAALIQSTCLDYYRKILAMQRTKEMGTRERRAAAVILDLNFGKCESDEYKRIVAEEAFIRKTVPFVVFIHNMYPENLNGLTWFRTHLKEMPFAYLTLFADATQKWDRKKLVNEANSKLTNLVPGSRFNASIEQDKIHFRMLMRGQHSGEDLLDQLKQFLANADSFATFELNY